MSLDVRSIETSRLSVKITLLDNSLCVDAKRIGKALVLYVTRKDNNINIGANRVGSPLKIECSQICEVAVVSYLRVSPEVIWLTPDSVDVFVESNVDWRIE